MEVTVIAGKKENTHHFLVSGEIYTCRSKKDGVKFVCCYHNGCNARGKINLDGNFVGSDGKYGLHSQHEYTTSSVVNFLACFNEMKEMARTSGKLPNVIYDEVMAKYEGQFEQVLTFPNVQQTLLICRRQYFPRFPQTEEEFFDAFTKESILERYGQCYNDLFFHGVIGNETSGRCAIFYTKRLLEFFDSVKHATKAFADATFKYQPSYFHQLYIVHFELGSYTFPAFYVFMERKTADAYQSVFEVIRNLGFNIIELMADFERAIKQGFLAVFPDGTVYGCHFHLAQALLRRMRKSKSMKVDYDLLRILSSLAFLPPDDIIPTFRKVKAKYCKLNNRKFFKYFEDFWIKKIGPHGFSVYGRDHTTNNVAESFHALIKNFIGVLANATASSKVWELIDQLIKIHHKMEIQLSEYSKKLFSGIIRTKSKKKSTICKNRLHAMYSRMRNNKVDFDGLHFVESLHDEKFVLYVEELENERLDQDEEDVFSEEEEEEAEASFVPPPRPEDYDPITKINASLNGIRVDRKYQCDICGASFMTRVNLQRHQTSHSLNRPHKCPICGKGFVRKEHLTKHLSSVHSGMKFTCEFCGKDISRKDHLIRHIRNVHPAEYLGIPPELAQSQLDLPISALQASGFAISDKALLSMQPKPKKPYLTCDMCDQTFTHINTLHEHQSTWHSDVRRFKCNFCPKAFKRKEHLTKHEVLHTGEKNFGCDHCGKEFPRKDALQDHIRRIHGTDHMTLIEYPCNFCEKVFLQRPNLLRHMKNMHGLVVNLNQNEGGSGARFANDSFPQGSFSNPQDDSGDYGDSQEEMSRNSNSSFSNELALSLVGLSRNPAIQIDRVNF